MISAMLPPVTILSDSDSAVSPASHHAGCDTTGGLQLRVRHVTFSEPPDTAVTSSSRQHYVIVTGKRRRDVTSPSLSNKRSRSDDSGVEFDLDRSCHQSMPLQSIGNSTSYHPAMTSPEVTCTSRDTPLPADPRQWSRQDVQTWLLEMSSGTVDSARFRMNGKALCLMTREMFTYRVPETGVQLFADFQCRLRRALYRTCPVGVV